MRKLFLSVLAAGTLLLSGCFESIQEVTINENGTGTYNTTLDMSALISMAKQMGGGKELTENDDKAIDSTIAMGQMADSMQNLSDDEKNLIKSGTLRINMNMKEEKFLTSLNFPFSNVDAIGPLNKLSGRIMAETMKDQMGKGGDEGGAEAMPETSSLDDYFVTTFSQGLITRTIDKEKYAKAADDEFMKAMKEAGGMGLAMKSTYVINLPRPATKAEGKNIVLSEDKKKVTIKGDIEDFFDDPSKMEFRIEY